MENVIQTFESLSDDKKADFLAFIRFLQETEDIGEPQPASPETNLPL